jgi:hypothetical protein
MQSNKDKGKPQSGDPKGADGAGNKVSAEMVAPQRSSLTPGGVQDGVTRGGTCETASKSAEPQQHTGHEFISAGTVTVRPR